MEVFLKNVIYDSFLIVAFKFGMLYYCERSLKRRHKIFLTNTEYISSFNFHIQSKEKNQRNVISLFTYWVKLNIELYALNLDSLKENYMYVYNMTYKYKNLRYVIIDILKRLVKGRK